MSFWYIKDPTSGSALLEVTTNATTWQAVAYNAPRSGQVLDWIIIGVAVLAPSTAACLLGWAWRHPPPVYS